MLVDPPLRYHLPQKGWVRLNRAIDEIPAVRQEFVDWLEYSLKDIDSSFSILDLDWIDISAGELQLVADGSGIKSPPPVPGHAFENLYKRIADCVWRAQLCAREALYTMISNNRFNVYARKYEHDADLQLMPQYVWEMTSRNREFLAASAALPSTSGARHYYDIHLELIEIEALSPDWDADLNEVDVEQVQRPTLEISGLVEGLVEAMEKAAPRKLTREEAKALLGFVKERGAKIFKPAWQEACRMMNTAQADGRIKFAGNYGAPSGNPDRIQP